MPTVLLVGDEDCVPESRLDNQTIPIFNVLSTKLRAVVALRGGNHCQVIQCSYCTIRTDSIFVVGHAGGWDMPLGCVRGIGQGDPAAVGLDAHSISCKCHR